MSSPLASRSNNWTRESNACGFCLANSFQKPAPYSFRSVYHCTNCKPEAEILQLIEPFQRGLRMSCHPFGASAGETWFELYAVPAGSAPVQKNEPFGVLRWSAL